MDAALRYSIMKVRRVARTRAATWISAVIFQQPTLCPRSGWRYGRVCRKKAQAHRIEDCGDERYDNDAACDAGKAVDRRQEIGTGGRPRHHRHDEGHGCLLSGMAGIAAAMLEKAGEVQTDHQPGEPRREGRNVGVTADRETRSDHSGAESR
jgi:hypothetical protein